MGNVINIDTFRGLPSERIEEMAAEGKESFYSVVGAEPQEGERETITIMRALEQLNLNLAAKGFVQEKGSGNPCDTIFEERRAKDEFLKFVRLQSQYREAEKREEEDYKKMIGLTPAQHHDLLYQNWMKKQKSKDGKAICEAQ